MRAARTDPHTQRIQLRHIIPLWSRRHRNAVPLKIRIFLHTPRIGLVGSVFAEFHRTKGNHALIKHSTVHTLPLIQLLQLSRKFHSLIHLSLIHILKLTVKCPQPVQVLMDRTHFIRVLDNLCQNSIKYRSENPVHIDVTLECDKKECILTFQDNGIGIDPSQAPRLFDSFYRSDPARSSKVKGNGLGLSITKQIITQMKGEICLLYTSPLISILLSTQENVI